MKINDFLVDNFWSWSFKTGLYDLLVMSSYYDSIRKIADIANLTFNCQVVDIGCGSGLLLDHMGKALKESNSSWTGVELTSSGVTATQRRIKRMELEKNARVLQSDITIEIPVPKESQDIAISHFCLYVIPGKQRRIAALKNIASVLKPNGKAILALPAKNYNAAQQVRSSVEIDKMNNNLSTLRKIFRKLFYHTLGFWAERSVADKIHKGVYHGYSLEELHEEVNAGGMEIEWIKDTYAKTSHMFQCKRNVYF